MTSASFESGAAGAYVRGYRWPMVALAAIPMLLVVYIPRPFGASHLATFPLTAAILASCVLLLIRTGATVDRRVAAIAGLLLIHTAALAITVLLNSDEIRTLAVSELGRPLVFATILIYGYLAAVGSRDGELRKGLLVGAQLVLVGQAVVAMAQLLGLDFFGILYTQDKSRPLGSLVRVTGTVGNPNFFAWMVAQSSVLILLCGSGRRRYLWLAFGAGLVVLSGSRTAVLLFPLIVLFALGRSGGAGWKRIMKISTLPIAIAGVFAALIFLAADQFPYLAQLQLVFATGSLASINSVAVRIAVWTEVWTAFSSGDGWVWAFGLGSREVTRIVDNDFLYILSRLGLVGLSIHLSLLAAAAIAFARDKSGFIGLAGSQYLLFALVLGMVSETLGGWNYPIFLYLYLGFSLGIAKRVDDPGGRVGWAES